MKPQLLFIVLFFSFCNQIENLSYEIKSINNLENVDTKLSIGIENKLNSKTELTFQFFPKNAKIFEKNDEKGEARKMTKNDHQGGLRIAIK